MEFDCIDCAYFDKCKQEKVEACADFIFKKRESDKTIVTKKEQIKKG